MRSGITGNNPRRLCPELPHSPRYLSPAPPHSPGSLSPERPRPPHSPGPRARWARRARPSPGNRSGSGASEPYRAHCRLCWLFYFVLFGFFVFKVTSAVAVLSELSGKVKLATGLEETILICARGGLGWTLGRISPQKG